MLPTALLSLPKAWLNYRSELRRYGKELEKSNRNSPLDDHDSFGWWFQEQEGLEQWRRLTITRYFESKADALGLILPAYSEDGMYKQVEFDDDERQPYYLTDQGLRAARELFRAEEKHRREVAGFWVTLFIGAIGSLTGLVSVFK